jgi:transcriptional regulator with XRE-family HTH domain
MIDLTPSNCLATQEMSDFAQLLKKLRAEKELSQEQLATRATMSAMTVSKLERGLHEPSPRTMDEMERELARDVVYVPLPRNLVDAITAKAAAKNQTVEEWIRKVAASRGVKIKKRLGGEGGERGASRSQPKHAPPL